jgi:hypothetical protein
MNRASSLPGDNIRPGPMAASWRSPIQTDRAVAAAMMLAVAAAAGVVAAIDPTVLVVVCAATVGAVAIASPSTRFAVVVGGGLFVLGTSDQLDPPKAAYLGWVALSVVLAIANVAACLDVRRTADLRPLVAASCAVGGAVTLAVLVALWTGTPFIDSMRDASAYGLVVVAPFLAWDGSRSRLGQHMEAVIVVAGLIASIGFSVEFLGRRGIADLPLASFGYSSGTLASLLFMVAVASLLCGHRRRLLWASLAAVVVSLLFVTGTRSTLVLLVGPIAMVIVGSRGFARLARLAGAAIVVGAIGVAIFFLTLQTSVIDLRLLTGRIAELGSFASNPSADQSFVLRATQASVALSRLAGSPVFGIGLGSTFHWTGLGGEPYTSFNIDTGLSVAAKFGFVGLAMLGVAVTGVLAFYRRLRFRVPARVRLTFVGFAVVTVLWLPLGNPLEDKGFGLALAMLFAWILASARTADTAHEPEAGVT